MWANLRLFSTAKRKSCFQIFRSLASQSTKSLIYSLLTNLILKKIRYAYILEKSLIKNCIKVKPGQMLLLKI